VHQSNVHMWPPQNPLKKNPALHPWYDSEASQTYFTAILQPFLLFYRNTKVRVLVPDSLSCWSRGVLLINSWCAAPAEWVFSHYWSQSDACLYCSLTSSLCLSYTPTEQDVTSLAETGNTHHTVALFQNLVICLQYIGS